jgi:hypothetical protein
MVEPVPSTIMSIRRALEGISRTVEVMEATVTADK